MCTDTDASNQVLAKGMMFVSTLLTNIVLDFGLEPSVAEALARTLTDSLSKMDDILEDKERIASLASGFGLDGKDCHDYAKLDQKLRSQGQVPPYNNFSLSRASYGLGIKLAEDFKIPKAYHFAILSPWTPKNQERPQQETESNQESYDVCGSSTFSRDTIGNCTILPNDHPLSAAWFMIKRKFREGSPHPTQEAIYRAKRFLNNQRIVPENPDKLWFICYSCAAFHAPTWQEIANHRKSCKGRSSYSFQNSSGIDSGVRQLD